MAQNEGSDNPSTERTGRFMMLLAWAAGLALLTLLFNDHLISRFNPNTVPESGRAADGSVEVALQRNASGHYVASGTINRLPVTFLLDTGATDVAVPESIAVRLGLERGPGGISQTANGPVAVWSTVLDEVGLGGIRLADVRASIVPSLDADAPVLLGMSFLKRVDFAQQEGRLILRVE